MQSCYPHSSHVHDLIDISSSSEVVYNNWKPEFVLYLNYTIVNKIRGVIEVWVSVYSFHLRLF